MVRKLALVGASLVAALAPTTALAVTATYELRLVVPVHCKLSYQAAGYGVAANGAVSLGQFREYCNAPQGYDLIVRYTPGTLQGAVIAAGEDRIVLSGSGEEVISQSNRPRFRTRAISAAPGVNGFDSDRLEFDIRPA